MLFFTKGYEQSLEQAINGAIFDEDHDESKLIKKLPVARHLETFSINITAQEI